MDNASEAGINVALAEYFRGESKDPALLPRRRASIIDHTVYHMDVDAPECRSTSASTRLRAHLRRSSTK
jgi:hypothetical protein